MRRGIQRAVLGVVATAANSDAAQAGFWDGNRLFYFCNRAAGVEACTAYIMGVADAMAIGPVVSHRACFPNGVTAGQVKDVVLNYLRAQPQRRHNVGVQLVAEALAEAFPCR